MADAADTIEPCGNWPSKDVYIGRRAKRWGNPKEGPDPNIAYQRYAYLSTPNYSLLDKVPDQLRPNSENQDSDQSQYAFRRFRGLCRPLAGTCLGTRTLLRLQLCRSKL